MGMSENLLITEGSGSDSIALALSGGGARAMAFHLGCLRALHDLGILQKVSTITAVSGGSVLAGLYCSHPGDFESFEARVREILRTGFMKPALIRAVTSTDGVKAVGVATALLAERSVAFVARKVLGWVGKSRPGEQWPNTAPFLRKASRTTILRNTLSKTFNGCLLKDLRVDRPRLIVIACELRSKAAFYYTRESLHCWRYGSASTDGVELADAVVASAAYPLFLPALDQRMTFSKNGCESTHRITLSDGGVYDNLGLNPLWPERDFSESLPVKRHDWIIACRAGYALEVTEPASALLSRMMASFESVFARSQNLAMTRLFDLKSAGKLKGFLLPYLGQKDSTLQYKNPDMVRADVTAGYPTNFNAMDKDWIERLVRRGEQIVHAQVKQHWPSALLHEAKEVERVQ
ncbi:patatin-like phospholipase family protein [Pseudomonas sp. JS425]|uniref:patatin-like phospholipase family protein n=1 Tax=Pseudomonas sp. JS425 TaxID=2829498 RepID=UPI001BAEBE30|nr:patatin-like phospholipase family protein [Pseudomonas sp. JS425]QUN66345.1 patatin-like phospholipase family protein [Pseudomonas sp. JS425]